MQNYLFPAFIFGETIFGGLTLLFEDEFFVLTLSLSLPSEKDQGGSLPWLILSLSALLIPVMGHLISSLQNYAYSSCRFASPGLNCCWKLKHFGLRSPYWPPYCMVESNLPSLIDNMASGQAGPSLVYSSYETISYQIFLNQTMQTNRDVSTLYRHKS